MTRIVEDFRVAPGPRGANLTRKHPRFATRTDAPPGSSFQRPAAQTGDPPLACKPPRPRGQRHHWNACGPRRRARPPAGSSRRYSPSEVPQAAHTGECADWQGPGDCGVERNGHVLRFGGPLAATLDEKSRGTEERATMIRPHRVRLSIACGRNVGARWGVAHSLSACYADAEHSHST